MLAVFCRWGRLNLSCGGFEYYEAVGSDSFTTMSWSARPGECTNYDGSWDDSWMKQDDYSDSPAHSSDFSGCAITVDDDDNPLLFESKGHEDDAEVADPPTEIYRRGEKIDLTLDEWRSALKTFEDWGWEPDAGLERFVAPPAFVKHDQGKAMQEAGHLLWREIDKRAVLTECVDLDIDLFLRLTQFVGNGAFIVGKGDLSTTENDCQISGRAEPEATNCRSFEQAYGAG